MASAFQQTFKHFSSFKLYFIQMQHSHLCFSSCFDFTVGLVQSQCSHQWHFSCFQIKSSGKAKKCWWRMYAQQEVNILFVYYSIVFIMILSRFFEWMKHYIDVLPWSCEEVVGVDCGHRTGSAELLHKSPGFTSRLLWQKHFGWS